jgi:hypothetical protein
MQPTAIMRRQRAYLTACVFYAAIAGRSPEGLPITGECKLSLQEALLLQSAVWETVSATGAVSDH